MPTVPTSYAYLCVVAGTSHAVTKPTWPTAKPGDQVTDGTVTWQMMRWIDNSANSTPMVAADIGTWKKLQVGGYIGNNATAISLQVTEDQQTAGALIFISLNHIWEWGFIPRMEWFRVGMSMAVSWQYQVKRFCTVRRLRRRVGISKVTFVGIVQQGQVWLPAGFAQLQVLQEHG